MKLKLGNFVDHQHIFLLFHFFHDLLLRFRLWRLLGCWASWACGGFFHAFGRFQWFWENSISERRRSCQFVQDWRNWKCYFCWSNSKACNWSSMFFWIIILLKTSYSSAAQTCAIMKYVLCISKNVKINHIGFQNSKRKKIIPVQKPSYACHFSCDVYQMYMLSWIVLPRFRYLP